MLKLLKKSKKIMLIGLVKLIKKNLSMKLF